MKFASGNIKKNPWFYKQRVISDRMNKKQPNFSIEVTEKDAIDFILEMFQKIKQRKSISDLIDFHTKNKYMIMAHSQVELNILGNLVANHNKINLEEILCRYESHLMSALKNEPTTNNHLNVIMHIFGYFARYFNQSEKDEFIEILRQYKEEDISIGKILAEIEPIIYKFNNTHLATQTYFLLYANMQQKFLFELNENKS